MSSNKSSTPEGAPPCKGPFIVPSADTIADGISDSVEMVTRAANVDAFKPCSIVNNKYVSSASTCAGVGDIPVNKYKKFAVCPRLSRDSTGSEVLVVFYNNIATMTGMLLLK